MISSKDNNELLTVAEAAKRYRVARQTVYTWIYNGRIEAMQVGGSVRISPDALNKVVTRKTPTKG